MASYDPEGEDHGYTRSANVPIRFPQGSSFQASGRQNTHLFVGSPDQLNAANSNLAASSSSQSNINRTPERPSLARSLSTNHGLSLRRTPHTAGPRPSSGLGIEITPSAHTPRGREWSLFGQMMENEVPLMSPTLGKRLSAAARSRSRARTEPRTPRLAHSETDPFDLVVPDTNLDIPEGHPSPEPFALADLPSEDGEEYSSEDDDGFGDYTDSDGSNATYIIPPTPSTPSPRIARWPLLAYLTPSEYAPLPLVYRNVLKCAIAYFVASLFTFSPQLSGLISDITGYGAGERKPVPSGHTIATIAVYFNPAKTMGGMLEADLYCFFGLLFSSFVCLSASTTFWWLDVQPGWEWVADMIIILWIGISMSIVAFMKVWMASPQFNTACSMIAIIIFVVIVKEGGLETLMQVTLIVLCGSLTSNLVCYMIWPSTATANLQINMAKTLDSFATVLGMLTDTFLLEDGGEHGSVSHHCQETLQRAVEGHQGSFTSLKKDLYEARSEWFWNGAAGASYTAEEPSMNGNETLPKKPTGGSRKAYEDAVDSMNRLAQHLNGLRSGTRLQYELTKAGVMGGTAGGKGKGRHHKKHGRGRNHPVATEAEDVEEEDEETVLLRAAAEMFGDLVDDLGPPLKALSSTCTSCLKRLRESFVRSRTQRSKGRKGIQPHEFLELIDGIERALVRFESTSNHAVMRIYRKSDFSAGRESTMGSARGSMYSFTGEEKELPLLTAGDNEHIFLVYFFIFTLQEFSRELTSLVDAMARIYRIEQERVHRAPWWRRACASVIARLKLRWKRSPPRAEPSLATSATTPGHVTPRASFSNFLRPGRLSRHRQAYFPKIQPHAPNTIQTPSLKQLTFIGRVKQRLWAIGERLGQRDTKYAIKAGMATALLASPAFFDATREIFVSYWGDWALISFFVVISPTIGATNFLSLHRVAGTLFGATVAAGIYTLFPEDPVVLSIFGFFFSLPCFYYIVAKPPYVSASRFVLLTYNLTCLYCYNVRDKDLSPVFVGFRRALAVTAGVVAAAAVSRFWWPSEARRELSKALGEFCLNIGWLYTRLVASNSFSAEPHEENEEDTASSSEGSTLLPANPLNTSIREFMAMELHLQIKLIELQGLLSQTQHEPRLKGPFPVQLYRNILISLQTILDRLHSMRCVTTREEWYTSVRQDFILPVNKERHDMVGNIILSFSTLASAFRLKAPLPPYLPPVEESRRRLVEAIRNLDIVKNRDVKGSRQLLFFAYALTMKGVTQELESLGRTLQNAFGVIGQTPEEFEALFVDSPQAHRTIDHAA